MTIEQDISLIKEIDECFRLLNGTALPSPANCPNRHKWLHRDAPYSILAHNIESDPHFIYANEFALSCFQYSLDEMLSLPSRLSAAEQDRYERAQLLDAVTRNGIAYNYTGPRIDKFGNVFNIYDGIVWQLRSSKGIVWGQAALFYLHDH